MRDPLGRDQDFHPVPSQTFRLLIALIPCAGYLAGQGAPACPQPQVDTSGWIPTLAHSPKLDFLLPPGFLRHHYDITVGTLPPSQEWRREPFVTFLIEEAAGPDSLSKATLDRLPGVEDYSECLERINGVRVVIQAQRGGGTIFDGGRQWKSFDVYATFERRPGLFVRVRGHASTRPDQELLLAMVRTVRLQ